MGEVIWGKERGWGSAGDTMGKRVGGGGVEWAESEEEDKGDLMLVRGEGRGTSPLAGGVA